MKRRRPSPAQACYSFEEKAHLARHESNALYVATRSQDPGHGPDLVASAIIKVFCFFSSEKKAFLLPASAALNLLYTHCGNEPIERSGGKDRCR
jgi:hypothetical protein